MAKKKPRTPPPPSRPVQAPRKRDGGRRRPAPVQAPRTRTDHLDMGLRHRAVLYGVAGAGIVALAAVVLVIALAGREPVAKAAVKSLLAAGCQYKHLPALARAPHFTSLHPSPPPHWNSYPPSSGRHFYQWVLWGDYTEPVPLIKEVHNLEHGGMIIQYGSKVPQSDIRQINDFYRKDATAMLVAPLPNLGSKIAMTAWTNWAECTSFNEKAFKGFQAAFRYHGPESPFYPKSALQPGE